MNDRYTYQIEVQGMVDENDLNAASPIQMTAVWVEPSATQLTFCTDQSGLIGLIRHLHARGLVLVFVNSGRRCHATSVAAHSPQFNNQSA